MTDKTMWRTRIGGQLYVKTIRSVYDGGCDPDHPYHYKTILVNGADNDCLVQILDRAEPPRTLPMYRVKTDIHSTSVHTLKIMYRAVAREVQQAIAGHFPTEY